MRVVPLNRPWKGHQPLQVFDFWISVLNIWKDFKVLSRFIQKLIRPPGCSDYGLYRIRSSYWLAHFYLLKNPPKGYTIWFGLQDVGILQIFYSRALIQRTIVDFPAFFFAQFGRKYRGLWPYKPWSVRRLRPLKCFKKFKTKYKKSKT